MSKDIFIVDRKYMSILEHAGISVGEVLKRAGLPEDLFSHKSPSINTLEYMKFLEAIRETNDDKELPLKISTVDNLETFSPPVFAAYCSKNGLMCMKRLSQYKKLIGSFIFNVIENKDSVSLEMTFEKSEYELPEYLLASELVFTLQLIRNATKKRIIPKEIKTKYDLDTKVYNDYFGVRPQKSSKNIMTIYKEDALIPFVSWNDSMWDYFELELKRRLSELKAEDSYKTRVNTALIELLPGGEASINDVAKKLGCSKRTLQRKLNNEKTTFQNELNSTREKLAKNYIMNFNMTNEEIAYLIGYCDCNSFVRAFNSWTGISLSEYKKEIANKIC